MVEGIPDNFRSLFSNLLRREEEDISLAEASWYIAGERYPDLDVSKCSATLDTLGRDAGQYVGNESDPKLALQRLSEYLFIREGFQGNHDDYYDPDNSYLNRVLERKLGIPITLSIIYMEVGLRLGLILEGIGLPGHFILRHGPPEWELYVDAFNEGRIISRSDCEQVVADLFDGRAQFSEELLLPCTKKQILVRMLTNLKGTYQQRQDYQQAVAAADRIAIIEPWMGSNLKDRAWLHRQLKQYRLAIKDLELYLKTTPVPQDVEEIKKQIQRLWYIIVTLN